MMYQALRGIGDDTTGDTGSGEAGTEGSAIPGSPTVYESPTTPTLSNAPGPNYVDTVTGNVINGATGQIIGPAAALGIQADSSGTIIGSTNPSGSFNLGTFLSSLFSTAGATTASVLNSGATTQQVQAQSAAQIAAAQASAAQSSTLMTLGLVGVAGVVLVMIFSGGKK